MELIDTHCHLDIPPLSDNAGEFIDRAVSHGVTGLIAVGIDQASSERAVGFAHEYPNVFASVGLHPHDAKTASDQVLDTLSNLAKDERVKAWGEIGLDFFKKHSPTEKQIEVFRVQLEMAQDLKLPVIIHSRDAQAELMDILEEALSPGYPAVIHCFSGDWPEARRALDMGLFLSFTGVITFPSAGRLREVVRLCPMDRIFVETDAPFLSPVPFRGKPNEPARITFVAESIAEIKGLDIEEVGRCTTENARAFFDLPVP